MWAEYGDLETTMSDPGGTIGEALRDCGAIKPKKRVSARAAAEKAARDAMVYDGPHGHFERWTPVQWRELMVVTFRKGVAWQKRLAKREGK